MTILTVVAVAVLLVTNKLWGGATPRKTLWVKLMTQESTRF